MTERPIKKLNTFNVGDKVRLGLNPNGHLTCESITDCVKSIEATILSTDGSFIGWAEKPADLNNYTDSIFAVDRLSFNIPKDIKVGMRVNAKYIEAQLVEEATVAPADSLSRLTVFQTGDQVQVPYWKERRTLSSRKYFDPETHQYADTGTFFALDGREGFIAWKEQPINYPIRSDSISEESRKKFSLDESFKFGMIVDLETYHGKKIVGKEEVKSVEEKKEAVETIKKLRDFEIGDVIELGLDQDQFTMLSMEECDSRIQASILGNQMIGWKVKPEIKDPFIREITEYHRLNLKIPAEFKYCRGTNGDVYAKLIAKALPASIEVNTLPEPQLIGSFIRGDLIELGLDSSQWITTNPIKESSCFIQAIILSADACFIGWKQKPFIKDYYIYPISDSDRKKYDVPADILYGRFIMPGLVQARKVGHLDLAESNKTEDSAKPLSLYDCKRGDIVIIGLNSDKKFTMSPMEDCPNRIRATILSEDRSLIGWETKPINTTDIFIIEINEEFRKQHKIPSQFKFYRMNAAIECIKLFSQELTEPLQSISSFKHRDMIEMSLVEGKVFSSLEGVSNLSFSPPAKLFVKRLTSVDFSINSGGGMFFIVWKEEPPQAIRDYYGSNMIITDLEREIFEVPSEYKYGCRINSSFKAKKSIATEVLSKPQIELPVETKLIDFKHGDLVKLGLDRGRFTFKNFDKCGDTLTATLFQFENDYYVAWTDKQPQLYSVNDNDRVISESDRRRFAIPNGFIYGTTINHNLFAEALMDAAQKEAPAPAQPSDVSIAPPDSAPPKDQSITPINTVGRISAFQQGDWVKVGLNNGHLTYAALIDCSDFINGVIYRTTSDNNFFAWKEENDTLNVRHIISDDERRKFGIPIEFLYGSWINQDVFAELITTKRVLDLVKKMVDTSYIKLSNSQAQIVEMMTWNEEYLARTERLMEQKMKDLQEAASLIEAKDQAQAKQARVMRIVQKAADLGFISNDQKFKDDKLQDMMTWQDSDLDFKENWINDDLKKKMTGETKLHPIETAATQPLLKTKKTKKNRKTKPISDFKNGDQIFIEETELANENSLLGTIFLSKDWEQFALLAFQEYDADKLSSYGSEGTIVIPDKIREQYQIPEKFKYAISCSTKTKASLIKAAPSNGLPFLLAMGALGAGMAAMGNAGTALKTIEGKVNAER